MVQQINHFQGNSVKSFLKILKSNTSFMARKQNFGLHFFTIFSFMLILICSSCSKEHRDKEIKADLTVKAKSDLNFAAVTFTVEDGVVTLTGKCSSEKSKHEAEEMVKGINIVKGIANNIVVAPVVLTTDLPMKQAVDSVLKDYPAVMGKVSGDTVVLEGKAQKQEVTKILPALNKLHPNKIDNRVTIQ